MKCEDVKPEKISEVRYYPLRPDDKGHIGFASCLYGRLSISSIAVYTKPDGDIRLLFPKTRLPNGKEVNYFFPVDNPTYEAIRTAVLRKIENVTEGAKNEQCRSKFI